MSDLPPEAKPPMRRMVASMPNPSRSGLYIGDIRIAAGAKVKDEDGNEIGDVINAWFAEDKTEIVMECEIEDSIPIRRLLGPDDFRFSVSINGVEI